MWQRKQTIYLALVAILMVVALTMMGTKAEGDMLQAISLAVYAQQALAAVTALYATWAIFAYGNRKRQMRLCRGGEVLCLALVALFAVQHWYLEQGAWAMPFHPALSIVSLILFEMAYKGVKHDDDLVRSADRIR